MCPWCSVRSELRTVGVGPAPDGELACVREATVSATSARIVGAVSNPTILAEVAGFDAQIVAGGLGRV